jgi:hypothetical protein
MAPPDSDRRSGALCPFREVRPWYEPTLSPNNSSSAHKGKIEKFAVHDKRFALDGISLLHQVAERRGMAARNLWEFAPLNHGGPFGNARVGDAALSPATVRRGKFTFCLHQYAHLRGLVFPSSATHMMRNRAMIGLITLASVILVALSLMAGVWLGGVLFCRALSILACGQLDT